MNMTADSHHYLNVAEQIYQNGFISIWKNRQLVYWPPLYPFILSTITGFEDSSHIRLLHFLVAASILFIWHFISIEVFPVWKKQLIYMVLLAISTHFLMISVFVWSELIFLLLFSLVILSVKKFVDTQNIKWLWISIAPAFLMLIERNAGIFILSPMYLSFFVFKIIQRRQFRTVAIYFIVSISGFLIWNVKNVFVESRLYLIYELVPYFTPFKNLKLVLNDIGSVIYPALMIYPFSILITIVILSIMLYRVFYSSKNLFLKILLFTSMCYLCIWIIIPGDHSNMGRFISVIIPIFLLLVIWVVFNSWIRLRKIFKYVIICAIFIYSSARILNNSLLWGGKSDYINFGKIHKNLFHDKSDKTIQRPLSQ